jgi:ABC-2 type transport system ATP-binding protein
MEKRRNVVDGEHRVEQQLQEIDREDAAIWTENLGRSFNGEVAVSGVTMTVPRGSIFGFIGPSGSGKTTTIRILTGVYEPTEGEVYVLGKQPAYFDQKTRARIGYMPQLFVLYPELTVWENLNFASSLYGMPFRRKKRLMQALEFVELEDHRGKLARDVSGGMQRRLSLASTLVHEPELVFLDEPTAGIDPVLRRKFWDHFGHLKEQGRTMFITTQYVSEATYCDLVGVLAEGRLLMVDTPHGLRYRAFGGDIVNLTAKERITYQNLRELRNLPFVQGRPEYVSDTQVRIIVSEAATDMQELLTWCEQQGMEVDTIEEYQPPFDDVFVELVQREGESQ